MELIKYQFIGPQVFQEVNLLNKTQRKSSQLIYGANKPITRGKII